MFNSVLEIKLSDSNPITPGAKVIFKDEVLVPAGMEYDNTTGIIKFKENGQYSIKWWVATETALKGRIQFELQPSKGSFTSGCSPIKTGQVSGFGVIDVEIDEAEDTTLSLVSKSDANVIPSKKAETKAYMLITPISPSSVRVYRGNLSTAGSVVQAPLGNGLYYRLQNRSATECRLVFAPMNGPTVYDYRRFSVYNGAVTTEGDYLDSTSLTGATTRDDLVLNNSREIHWVLVRVQNPVSMLWSTYEVRFFLSGGISRATVWVNVIEEEVSY